jgi:hypothetical protein
MNIIQEANCYFVNLYDFSDSPTNKLYLLYKVWLFIRQKKLFKNTILKLA